MGLLISLLPQQECFPSYINIDEAEVKPVQKVEYLAYTLLESNGLSLHGSSLEQG